jgi:membrane associated rhomboid family serine protease
MGGDCTLCGVNLRPIQRPEVIALLVVTIGVFAYQSTLPLPDRLAFEERFGAVPTSMWEVWRALRAHGLDRDTLFGALPLVTANYLHADFMHIGMNMLFFWIFGNIVSQVAGRVLFVGLYVLAGIIAVLVHVRTNPDSDVPMIGASGAIAGLEGAYFAFAFRWEMPHAHVWPLDGPVPAWRLGIVALVNFALDTHAFFGRTGDHVAYGAHVGGFLGGAMLAMAVATFYRPQFRKT